MKRSCVLCSFGFVLFFAVALHGQGAAAKRQRDKSRTPATEVNPASSLNASPAPEESEPTARVVHYGEKDLVKLNAKLRYTTLIVLPKAERILDFTCGDKEYWVVNGAENMAYIKPARAGAQTNLNLITASGNIYSFMLTEVSETPEMTPDLKVFVEPKDESMVSAASGAPRFVSAQAVEDSQKETELAHEETQRVKQAEQRRIDQGIERFIASMRFSYRFSANRKPFYVGAMYHDDKFTYIQAHPQEAPVLYEILDGKPNLINFEYSNGVYVVHKVLDRGYRAIGKAKLHFERKD